jgi:hypothetical protein
MNQLVTSLKLKLPSHLSAEGRHTVVEVTNLQFASQQSPDFPLFAPSSHCSLVALIPSPHFPLQRSSTPAQIITPLDDWHVLVDVQLFLSSQAIPTLDTVPSGGQD